MMNSTSITNSLEHTYVIDAFPSHVDVDAKINFTDFLTPNEGGVAAIKPHLNLMKKGVIVSPGTERSFFNLILSPQDQCEGLIIRDINPRTKAYVDFNTMVLRIAGSREEYVRLTSPKNSNEEREVILTELKEKLLNSDMPQKTKEYYERNLENFFRVFSKVSQAWRSKIEFAEAAYPNNDILYEKVQKYAKEGKIISTLGNINDLDFIDKNEIGLIDTSNICSYEVINPKNKHSNFNPIIVWTKVDADQHINTLYHSYQYELISADESKEIDNRINECVNFYKKLFLINPKLIFKSRNPHKLPLMVLRNETDKFFENHKITRLSNFERSPVASYTKNALNELRKHTDYLKNHFSYLDISPAILTDH